MTASAGYDAVRNPLPHRCWYRQQHTIGCVMSGENGRGCACPTESVCRLCAEPQRHAEACCMVGVGPDKGPHPDCPGSGA